MEGSAPLRKIVETKPGPMHVLEGDGIRVELRTVVHELECGHTTEPYVRDGCRVPKLPKRRRCRQCAAGEVMDKKRRPPKECERVAEGKKCQNAPTHAVFNQGRFLGYACGSCAASLPKPWVRELVA
jgi:hypothetical protein